MPVNFVINKMFVVFLSKKQSKDDIYSKEIPTKFEL